MITKPNSAITLTIIAIATAAADFGRKPTGPELEPSIAEGNSIP